MLNLFPIYGGSYHSTFPFLIACDFTPMEGMNNKMKVHEKTMIHDPLNVLAALGHTRISSCPCLRLPVD
jgi:hypothetical protein